MADPADLLKAWQHAIRDLGGAAASLASGPAGAASDLVRPLQHQAELLQQVLQRQLEFERELVGRAAAPLHAAQDLVDGPRRSSYRHVARGGRRKSLIFSDGAYRNLMREGSTTRGNGMPRARAMSASCTR